MRRKHRNLFVDDDFDDRYLKGDNTPSFSTILAVVVVLFSFVVYLFK